MGPGRKSDEKYGGSDLKKTTFIEIRRETMLEDQPFEVPSEREVLVVRVDMDYLKLYSFLLGFVLVVIMTGVLWG